MSQNTLGKLDFYKKNIFAFWIPTFILLSACGRIGNNRTLNEETSSTTSSSDSTSSTSATATPTPTPTAAASSSSDIILFTGSSTYDGNLGGRAGIDAKCTASTNKPTTCSQVRGFISTAAGDQLSAMPTTYSFSSALAIVSSNGTSLGSNWADLLDSAYPSSLFAASVLPNTVAWWSGSVPAGTFENACSNWTSNSGVLFGTTGRSDQVDSTWMQNTSFGDCSTSKYILCICVP